MPSKASAQLLHLIPTHPQAEDLEMLKRPTNPVLSYMETKL